MRRQERSRGGFLLMDAMVGMLLLGVLLAGLHQLRSVQARGVKSARARLAATETAGALALLAGLAPPADAAAQRALIARLSPGDTANVTLTSAALPDGRGTVTARVPWRAGKVSGFEEVSALAIRR